MPNVVHLIAPNLKGIRLSILERNHVLKAMFSQTFFLLLQRLHDRLAEGVAALLYDQVAGISLFESPDL
jgi:hypothetical protein